MPSGISYLDESWNLVTGCSKVSEGCINCWSARLAVGRLKHHPAYQGLAYRDQHGHPQWTGEVQYHWDKLEEPLHWRKPRRIGVAFMGDLFHEVVPAEFIAEAWLNMVISERHTFLLLTKRAERMKTFMDWLYPGALAQVMPENIWLGVTVENQEEANRRIPILLQTPAAKRWVSIEPMLGPVDLSYWLRPDYAGIQRDAEWTPVSLDDSRYNALDWVIVGCESGPGARPMERVWARNIKDQCVAARVPFYFRQEMLSKILIHGPFLDRQQWMELPR